MTEDADAKSVNLVAIVGREEVVYVATKDENLFLFLVNQELVRFLTKEATSAKDGKLT